jgi:hypothetical protein
LRAAVVHDKGCCEYIKTWPPKPEVNESE